MWDGHAAEVQLCVVIISFRVMLPPIICYYQVPCNLQWTIFTIATLYLHRINGTVLIKESKFLSNEKWFEV